jgi:hypothetical protein
VLRIQGQKDPGSGSASKNLGIFNLKNCFYVLGKIIWDVHPGSVFSPPDLGSRGQKNTGSATMKIVIVEK